MHRFCQRKASFFYHIMSGFTAELPVNLLETVTVFKITDIKYFRRIISFFIQGKTVTVFICLIIPAGFSEVYFRQWRHDKHILHFVIFSHFSRKNIEIIINFYLIDTNRHISTMFHHDNDTAASPFPIVYGKTHFHLSAFPGKEIPVSHPRDAFCNRQPFACIFQ